MAARFGTALVGIRSRVPLLAAVLVLTGCGVTPSATPGPSPTWTAFATSSPAPTPRAVESFQPSDATRPRGPYLGQPPPGTKPEIFARGLVSDPAFTEYSGAFSPDGTEYYFYRFSESSPSELLWSRMIEGTWTDPVPLAVAAGYAASEPHVTLDNLRLYFMWDRPVPEGQPTYLGDGGYYVAERTTGGWSDPTYAGQGMFMSSTRDGRLYTTDMSSTAAGGATYLAQITIDHDGVFTRYERLAIEPFVGSQAHPCISPDGRYLLFDVHSGARLFLSFRQADGAWGHAIDLSTHGFDPLAGGATISPDGKYLFFSLRDDIWWVSSEVIEALGPTA